MSDNGYVSGSNLEKVLKAGHFGFTGECGPPKGANVEHLQEKMEPLKGMVDGGAIFMQSHQATAEDVWARIPKHHQQTIIKQHLHVYYIDMVRIARDGANHE